MARRFFDLSDLYDYFLVANGVTGVQRVVMEVCAVAARGEARFVAYSRVTGGFLEIDGALLRDRERAIAAFSLGDPAFAEKPGFTRPSLAVLYGAGMVLRIVRSRLETVWLGLKHRLGLAPPGMGRPVRFEAGDSLVILGLPNNRLSVLDASAALAQTGVQVYVFCHDTLPITQPEFFDAVGRAQYRSYFTRAAKAATAFLANSQATAADVRTVMAQLGLAEKPVHVVPLAHEVLGQPSHSEARPPYPPPRDPRVQALEGTPFILSVGTIEVRKNHLRLLKAYQALGQRHGRKTLPKLVIVGREGWKIGPFKALMAETNALDGQVQRLGGLPDSDLVWLYRNCLFSVYPSLAEGWGLPAGESAWLGAPCLTSNRSAMPEALGRYGQYCDPTSEASIAEALERLIFDTPALEDARTLVRAMPLRRWSDVADNVLAITDPARPKAPEHL